MPGSASLPSLLLIPVLVSLVSVPCVVFAVQCHSCFRDCRTSQNGKFDPNACDCADSTEKCTGNFCFAKIEIFPREETAVIQKGCSSDIPGGQSGCQYAGSRDSIHCYCEGDDCNVASRLDNYRTRPLPTVECCKCSEPRGDEKCPGHGCLKKCRGNYCLIDFDGIEQGCGKGYPRLQNFLRTNNYADWQGQTTCARYQATLSTVLHGCTCTKPTGSCNEYNKTRNYAIKNMLERRADNLHYCYSLHHKSPTSFGQEVYDSSDTCEGQFCFVSLTTSELVVESADFEESYDDHDKYVAMQRPRFEILAGCLKVDDDNKVQTGCFSEYYNSTVPLTKHCICQGHLCNFHHLLTDSKDNRQRSRTTPSSGGIGRAVIIAQNSARCSSPLPCLALMSLILITFVLSFQIC